MDEQRRNKFLEALSTAFGEATKNDLRQFERAWKEFLHGRPVQHLWVMAHLARKGAGRTSVSEVYADITRGAKIHDETQPISWHDVNAAVCHLRDTGLVDITFERAPDPDAHFSFDAAPLFWKFNFDATGVSNG